MLTLPPKRPSRLHGVTSQAIVRLKSVLGYLTSADAASHCFHLLPRYVHERIYLAAVNYVT
jgi:hypothetical protein